MSCAKENKSPPARRISECLFIEMRTHLIGVKSNLPSVMPHFDNKCGVRS